MYKINVYVAIALVLLVASSVSAAKNNCARIKDGTIVHGSGELITRGFDDWGYNYRAHKFVGGYCDAYRDAEWCQDQADIILYMRWNNAWLSNKDCDGDGHLDRHFGKETYIGSGARLFNLQKGFYYDEQGVKQRWTYTSKIVAVPTNAETDGEYWYTPKGKIIGPVIWGEFALIYENYKDTGEVPEPDAVSSFGVATHSAQAINKKNPRYQSPFTLDFDQFTPLD